MLKVEARGPVLRIALDRPEVRNAFNSELITRLFEVFRCLDPSTRVVVIRGEGPTFCAGGDLNWMRAAANLSHTENVDDAVRLGRLYDAIQRCSAVVIASVHGAAFGGGCGLVAAADIAVADASTKFSFSEVRLGIVPGVISTILIPKIGASHARALFVTGEVFDSKRAALIGLVHEVRDGIEGVALAVEDKVKAVLASGPKAVAGAKSLVFDSPLTIEQTAQRLADARTSDEGREGLAAFLEKRKAAFVVEPEG